MFSKLSRTSELFNSAPLGPLGAMLLFMDTLAYPPTPDVPAITPPFIRLRSISLLLNYFISLLICCATNVRIPPESYVCSKAY